MAGQGGAGPAQRARCREAAGGRGAASWLLLLVLVVAAAAFQPNRAEALSVGDLSADRYFSPNGDGQEDEATVSYALDAPAHVYVFIRNAAGDRVRIAEANASRAAGSSSFAWDGRDDAQQFVPDGVYTYTVTAQGAAGAQAAATGRIGVDTRAPVHVVAPAADETIAGEVAIRVEPADHIALTSLLAFPLFCWDGFCYVSTFDVAADGSATVEADTARWNAGANHVVAATGYLDQFGEPHSYTSAPVAVQVARDVRIEERSADRDFSPNGDGQEDTASVGFRLTADAATTVAIADGAGRVVRTIETANPRPQQVWQSFSWDGLDDAGDPAPDGVYDYTVQADGALGGHDAVEGRIGVDRRTPVVLTSPAAGAQVSGPIVPVRVAPAAGLVLTGAYVYPGSCASFPCFAFDYEVDADGAITVEASSDMWATGPGFVVAGASYLDRFGESHGFQTPSTAFELLRPLRVGGLSADRYFSPDGDGQDDEVLVTFGLSADALTTIDIRNADGLLVRRVESDAARAQGGQTFSWDGRDEAGTRVPDGVYTYLIHAGGAFGESDEASGRVGVDTRPPAVLASPVADAVVDDAVAVRAVPADGIALTSLAVSAELCPFGFCWTSNGGPAEDDGLTLTASSETWAAGTNALLAFVTWTDPFGAGHQYAFPPRPIVVARALHVVQTAADRYISPDGDGQEDVAYVGFTLTADASTTIRIADAAGDVVRTIEAASPRPQLLGQSFTWDGRDDDGVLLADGAYTYTIAARDPFGSEDVATGRIGLDTEPLGATVPQPGDTLASIAQLSFAPRAGLAVTGVEFCLRRSGWQCAAVHDVSEDGIWRTSDDTLDLDDGPLELLAWVSYDDAFGASHQRSIPIPVSVDNTTPGVDLLATPTSGPPPLVVAAKVAAFQPRGATLAYTLDFGDGSAPATGTIAAPYEPLELRHAYADPGSYRLHVAVDDQAGHTAERSVPIEVRPAGDETPPTATILSGPSGPIASDATSFTFKASEAGSTFACALDAGDFAACESPASYDGLAEGEHSFQVRATDPSGNAGAAAARRFAVDTSPPETVVDEGPDGHTTDHAPAFAFSSGEPGTFRCALDGGLPEPCQSPRTYPLLGEGPHSFSVGAVDLAGNADPTPAVRAFTIDPLPPENAAPTATLELDAEAGAAPFELHAAIGGDDADGDALRYRLSFGDGSPVVEGALPASDPPAHVYAQPGTYVVHLAVDDGVAVAERSATVRVALPEPLTAVAGDDVRAPVGQPLAFDGGGSRPGALISSYEWDFGDGASAAGAQASHVYATPGTYTARLTVHSGDESASDAVTVQVDPPTPPDGLVVRAHGDGAPLAGAQATIVAADGSRRSLETGGDGTVVFGDLADGTVTVYVWADGYRPKAVTATVAGGRGEVEAALERGEIGATTLESHRLTYEEILDKGIDVADPQNSHVYEAKIHLYFVPDEPEGEHDVHVYVTPDGVMCASNCRVPTDDDPGPGPPLPSCFELFGSCFAVGGYQYLPTVTYVAGEPIIQWLVLPMRASFLKEFFDVKLIVQNLTEGFSFSPGVASLQLPAGLSLAPTPTPQHALRQVGGIPGGESRTVDWVVRGDVEGEYDLSADYSTTVEPVARPLRLVARTQAPLKVWGASALDTTIRVDEKAVRWGPYAFDVEVHNRSDVPVYNMQVEMLDREPDAPKEEALFFYAPGLDQVQGTGAIAPGDTWVAHYVVFAGLGNEEVTRLRVVLADSFVERTGGDVDLDPRLALREGSSAGPQSSPIVVRVERGPDGIDRANLSWQRRVAPDGSSVAGYELYTRQSLTGGAWEKHGDVPGDPSGQEHASLSSRQRATGRYYALVTRFSDGSRAFGGYRVGIGPPRYASLGDSFSSGEGVPVFEPGTAHDVAPIQRDDFHPYDTTCHRSFGSYGRLLVRDPAIPANLEPSVFAACSGAVARDLQTPNADPEKAGEPAQMSHVNQFTDVITLSLGGNDVGFRDIAAMCVAADCATAIGIYDAIGSTGWLDALATGWTEASFFVKQAQVVADAIDTCFNPATLPAKLWCAYKAQKIIKVVDEVWNHDPERAATPRNLSNGSVRRRLREAYADLTDRAPNAHVFVQLYPQLVSWSGPEEACPILPDLPFTLSKAERQAVTWVVSQLNGEVLAAIEDANAHAGRRQFEAVDPASEFASHELCRGGARVPERDTYFNSVMNPLVGTPLVYSFHPNSRGQEAYERALRTELTQSIEAHVLHVRPRAAVSAGGVFVPFGARTLHADSAWRGSTVTMTLVSPSGIEHRVDTPGVRGGGDATSEWLELDDPEPGTWQVRLFGDDVPPEGEPAQVSAYADSTPPPPPEAASEAEPLGTAGDAFELSADGPSGAAFHWTFSDGTAAEGAQVRHTFANVGSWWATVQVVAPTGESSWSTLELGNRPDEQPPAIEQVPADRTVEATGPDGARVEYAAPQARDAFDGAVPVVCLPRSGAPFPLGATAVACTATDAAGNVAHAGFAATVVDTTPPQMADVPSGVAVSTAASGGTTVSYPLPTAHDLVDGALPVACTPPSGSTFALGRTQVACSATDAAGNRVEARFDVSVTRLGDTTPPLLRLPGPRRVEATGPAGAVVTYSVSAVDGGRQLRPTCSPPSGSRFPLGATVVRCTATDAAGNTATGSFPVTVSDTTPPRLADVPRRVVATATSAAGAVVRWTLPHAHDRVDPHPAVGCAPRSGATFPVGRTRVLCTATDAAGNRAAASFEVVVQASRCDRHRAGRGCPAHGARRR